MKYKYLCALILSLLAIFYFAFNGEREDKKDPSFRTHSYIEGLRIVHKKDGGDSWVVTARKADFTRDETVAKMDTVAIDVVSKGILLNADAGTYNLETKELRLEDNIQIRIRDSVISVKDLVWDPSSGMLTSADRVEMDGSRFRIEGEGLIASEDQKLKLLKNVKATFF